MIYIVTGFMRTGTSLMMQILQSAGIPPHYSEELEARNRRGGLPNKSFLESRESLFGNITNVPDGHCVKVFMDHLHKINLDNASHRLIVTYRPSVPRLASASSGVKYENWTAAKNNNPHASADVGKYYDQIKFPHIIVEFDRLFDDTQQMLNKIAEHTGIAAVKDCSKTIEQKRRHHLSS